MTKWEYWVDSTLKIPNHDLDSRLDEAGKDGWELIWFDVQHGFYLLIYKRERVETE